jgi:hypothetical protein
MKLKNGVVPNMKEINSKIWNAILNAESVSLDKLNRVTKKDGDIFVVPIDKNMDVKSHLGYFGGKEITIIICSVGDKINTLTITDNKPLFTIDTGVTLILEDINIVAQKCIQWGVLKLGNGYLILKDNYILDNYYFVDSDKSFWGDSSIYFDARSVQGMFCDLIDTTQYSKGGLYWYGHGKIDNIILRNKMVNKNTRRVK